MTEEHKPDTAAPEGSPSQANKARAAFEEYRRRMGSPSGQPMMPPGAGGPGGMPGGQPGMAHMSYGMPGQPYGPPGPWPYGPPGAWPYGPPGAPPQGWGTAGGWGSPQGPAQQMPSPPGGPASATPRSLFESIGSMIRMGVEALNAGLSGGMQIVEGLAGSPGPWGEPGGHAPYPQPGCQGCHGYACHHGGSYGHQASSCCHGGCGCQCGHHGPECCSCGDWCTCQPRVYNCC